MDLKEQILVALGLNKKEEEVTLAFQAKSDDGTIFVSTAEELESGVDISVLTEDGTTIPVPAGTYKLDTGVSFRVEDEGIVAEVLQSETEETEEVEAAEEDDRKEEADVGDWEGMEKRIQNLEDAVADLKRDKEGGDDEVEEMTEEVSEPTTNPKSIKTTETVEFSAEEVEAIKAENEKLKTELAESPADAPINTNKFSSERPTPTKQDFRRMTKQEKFLYELYK
jgi:regulator of replication initiation timing